MNNDDGTVEFPTVVVVVVYLIIIYQYNEVQNCYYTSTALEVRNAAS